MRDLLPDANADQDEAARPAYLRLAAAVRAGIEHGRLAPSELLPSTRQLAAQWHIHRHTVMAALDELVAEGWIEAEPGRGYRVVRLLPAEFVTTRARPVVRQAPFEWRLARSVRTEWAERPTAPYRFPSGVPDLRLFPSPEYFAEVRHVLRTCQPAQLLNYQSPGGCTALVEALGTYLRQVRGITEGEIVVTHGSQEAIFLIAQLVLRPHDEVAVERLGYPPAWEALRAAGARLVPIEVDADGLSVQDLETALARRTVRLIYLTPLHQYPTTVTLSASRRLCLYRLAEQYGVPILEDDYDHEFHYRSQPVAPLKSRDGRGLVAYVSTFSKILYPAARLGFAVVPPALAAPLRAYKRIVSRQNDTVTERAVASWLMHGGLERHLRRVRRHYEERMNVMADALARHLPEARMRLPDGGMSLWVDVGMESTTFSQRALARGVMVQDAREFDLLDRPTHHVRLGFASSDPDEIRAGVAKLGEVVREAD